MSRSFINNEEIENLVIIPPDGGWGWFVVFSSFFNCFVIDGISYTFGLYLTILSEEFNVGIGSIALCGSVMCATAYISGPFVGALMNKYDFRCVAFSGSLIASGALIICSYTTDYKVFLITYGLMLGWGLGMMYVPALILPSLYFTSWRALASGISSTGSGVGTLMVPPIVTPLIENFGWRDTYRIIIGLVLLAGLLTLSYIPLQPVQVVSKKLKRDRDTYFTTVYGADELSCFQKYFGCGICSHYDNKNFPTTNQIVPTNDADFMEDTALLRSQRYTMRGSETSTVGNVRSVAPSSRFFSTFSVTITNRDCLKYTCLACFHSECCLHDTKPLYRDDIFYNQSISLIPKYKQQAVLMKKKMREKRREKERRDRLEHIERSKEEYENFLREYHMEVTRVQTIREWFDRPTFRCHISVIRALVSLLHLELFKSFTFLLIISAAFTFTFGYNIPFMYIVDRGNRAGIDPGITYWFLATIGGANTIGRLLSGLLPTIMPLSPLFIVYSFSFICGIMTCCSGLNMQVWYQFTAAAVFGFFGAGMMALRSVVIVELFGLANLTNVIGLQLLMCGVAAIFGPTLAGVLYDETKTYSYSFYLAGACLFTAGLLLICIKKVRRWELKRQGLTPDFD